MVKRLTSCSFFPGPTASLCGVGEGKLTWMDRIDRIDRIDRMGIIWFL
jgi:hypothetical protein